MSLSDVETRPELDEDTLVDQVDRGDPQERGEALKELLRRESSRVRPFLGRIVADRTAPSGLRTTAAVALGKEATPENERALITALAADDPAVVAAAARGLGRIGGPEAFGALTRTTGRGVDFAQTLISYRLGLGSRRLAEPEAAALLDLDPRRAITFRFEPPADRPADAALRRELPAIPVAETGSVRFRCRNEHLWILVSGDAARAPRGLTERDLVTAVVLKESTCPDGWQVYEYIVAHPRKDGGAAMFGVRPTGRLVHFGLLAQTDVNADIRLQALDAPGVMALEFTAEYIAADGSLVPRSAQGSPPSGRRRNPPASPARAPTQD
ncbi:HEAT repeat domain-containing protein [Actinomadura fibrosa]|uniref:HEAT repeat domain-containing protein n=1 Tax=Actinomadura fibrosa TaxID=111802 RepID=A0ABW2Y2H7_9ACTN|nr:HEAT repeat domain-containing protein [Actinomadura fibrosa]